MKRILDADFRYVPARVHETGSDYLRNKFRKLMREHEAKRKANADEAERKVKTLRAK